MNLVYMVSILTVNISWKDLMDESERVNPLSGKEEKNVKGI